MSWRIVIVSSHAKLDLQIGFMQIRGDDGTRRIILDEIDILLVESTAVSIMTALLAELVSRKVKVIFCDGKRLPNAELVPFHGCHDSARRLKIQYAFSICRLIPPRTGETIASLGSFCLRMVLSCWRNRFTLAW